eukprot:CAMPEP_0174696682 /NCGR_PEP_ID=MMETSP1094-20130205/2767_1 /TAXON_ID=156173 /ORGANISM="Chrysochromulina brevifilum, Strain UTEX LB 985" /LENGTH=308 /DNA_ID=CAMNT_0015893509 /DNA_START=59 /DNA_END=985 /DNA_ORIENTATION=-
MTVDSTYRGRRSMMGTQANSELPSAPCYGFGTAERAQLNAKVFVSKDMVTDKFGVGSPGPVYHPKAVDGHYETPPSHSFGVSHRYSVAAQKRSGAPVPGPGQYTIPGSVSKQHDSQKHSYSSWKFGTSTRADQAKVFVSPAHAKSVTEFIDSPGPCAYGHRGGIGNQSDSRKNTSESFGMGTSGRFFYDNTGAIERKGAPGPGTYTLKSAQGRQVTSNKPSYPISSFPRSDRDKINEKVYQGQKQQQAFWGKNSPGPAVYSPTNSVGAQVSSEKPNVPKFGFGTADRFAYMNIASRAMQSPGPGSYGV